MLIRLLKNQRQWVYIFMLLLGALLWIRPLLHPVNINFASDSYGLPLYRQVVALLHTHWQQIAVAYVLAMIQASLMASLSQRHSLLPQRNYMTGMIFMIFSCSFLPLLKLHPALFGNIFLLAAINQLFSSLNRDRAIRQLFEAGVWIGIGSLFHINQLFMMLFVWVSLAFSRSFYWREWVAAFLGLLMVWFVYISVCFLLDKIPTQWFEYKTVEVLDISWWYYVLLSASVILLLVSIPRLLRLVPVQKISIRNAYTIVLLLSVITSLSYFFPWSSFDILLAFCISFSFFVSMYIMHTKPTRYTNLIAWLFVALVVCIHVFA